VSSEVVFDAAVFFSGLTLSFSLLSLVLPQETSIESEIADIMAVAIAFFMLDTSYHYLIVSIFM
jgi:hypothetical protein